ncbi:MAG: DNA alkylation repair protein [Cyclobacteriaceae bacterium]|nr:DNA alkylation repair protein [Cyclobacteriaceae bacterium]
MPARKSLKSKPKTKSVISSKELTAKKFIDKLKSLQSDAEKEKLQRYFKTDDGSYGAGDTFMGIRMGSLFGVAKEFMNMPVKEIEKLLENKIHEVRAGAVSIMDKSARDKHTGDIRRKELFDLYMRRHDRINNWDLVDLGCLHMTGSYLFDKPRTLLYKMAKSKNMWERRTAILSTTYFIRHGDLNDTYKISEMLLKETEDLVQKAAGWMLRFAGDKDHERLIEFLDEHASTMPRTMLRNTLEKLDKKKKDYYMKLK